MAPAPWYTGYYFGLFSTTWHLGQISDQDAQHEGCWMEMMFCSLVLWVSEGLGCFVVTSLNNSNLATS